MVFYKAEPKAWAGVGKSIQGQTKEGLGRASLRACERAALESWDRGRAASAMGFRKTHSLISSFNEHQ